MSYIKYCVYCHKQFEAKRKDNIYHSNSCRVTHWKLLQDFKIIGELIPEAEVKKKYYVLENSDSTIYLQWYRINGERFADVYVSNGSNDVLIKKLIKSTSAVVYNENGSARLQYPKKNGSTL